MDIHLNTSAGRCLFTIDDDLCLRLDSSTRHVNAKMIGIFIGSYLSLLSDSPLAKTCGQKPLRVYAGFVRTIAENGLKPLVTAYANLSHVLVSSLLTHGDSTPTGEFLDQFKDTPIFKEYLCWYRTADPELLSYIYTFLNFGKKLWYVDESLDSTAFRKWEEVEERLSGLELPKDILPWLRKIVRGLLADGPLPDVWPKFGPGAVAEPKVRGVIAKSNNVRYDARLDRAFFRGFFVNFGLNDDRGFCPDKFLGSMSPPIERERDSGISRLRFVPKDLTKARSICMETNTRMLFQQAYMRVLLQQMDNGVCGRFVRLEDQSRNRLLAEYGSYSTDIDTLDLSAASDSVHIDLVRSIFPPRELYFLLATRSSRVDVGRMGKPRVRHVRKFAPMGSALCFPVQCIVFTSIVILAAVTDALGGRLPAYDEKVSKIIDNLDDFVDQHFFHSVGYISPLLKKYQPAAVYGDDICVDRRLTPYVTSLLTSLGFVVNNNKSFVGSQAFRESCGGYYWQGCDITPLYFRIPYHTEPNAEVMMSALSLANAAGDRRYLNLRRHLIHYLLENYRFVRFSSDRQDTCSIYTTRARNSHLRRRFNADLQRDELLGLAVEPARRVKPRNAQKWAQEDYLYRRWWASRIKGIVPDFNESASRYDASGARLVGRWTPDW